jgi:hypothetical protein
MNCLENTIGIIGCNAPEPSTGQFVNDLPGITSFMVGNIASREDVTFLATWEKIQERALKKFGSAVIAAFKNRKKLKIKTVTQTIDLGRMIDDSAPLAASAQYRGIAIELVLNNTNYYLDSSLQVIYVSSIAIYSPGAFSDFAFKVYDLQTGTLLDTITEDLVSGWNTIRVATAYDALRIFIGYDASAFESVALSINQYNYGGCQSGCDTIYGIGNCSASVMGAVSADIANPTTISKGSDTYGLSAVFSVQCKYDWLVCNNTDQFILPWQYLLGAEVMTERIYSDRENRFTGIDLEKARELRAEFEAGFTKELETAIDGIDFSENDCCVECVEMLQKPYSLP